MDDGPEPKLELIGGRLVCGTMDGSRQLLWMLLESHGPEFALALAEGELWLAALQAAFALERRPSFPSEWLAWAQQATHPPVIPRGAGRPTWPHWRVHQTLSLGLHAEASHLGQVFGRDFVMRLGDEGFTPDLLFVRREHLSRLRQMYLAGPADLVIEIVWPASADQDREVKRGAYASGGVAEYWLIDPYHRTAEFLVLRAERHYREASPDADGVYRSAALPGLELDTRALWGDRPARPGGLLPSPVHASAHGVPPLPATPEPERVKGEWHASALPFCPRLDLMPAPISFDEYIAWCPEAKLELIEGKVAVGGREGSQRMWGTLSVSEPLPGGPGGQPANPLPG